MLMQSPYVDLLIKDALARLDKHPARENYQHHYGKDDLSCQ
jgi:hypothetical protein